MPAPERTLSVFMDQNNKCNLKCVMCGFSDARVPALPKYDMPFWLFEKVATQVFPRARYLTLSCFTEPLMTRDFAERLRVLGEHPAGFSEMITNAMLLTEKVADAMVDSGLDRVGISIDGATKETYERIRVGASFEKVLANVRLFTERKKARGADHPKLRIDNVVTEMNVDEMPRFLELVEELGAECVDFRTAVPMSDAKYKGSSDPVFYRKVLEARELIARFCERTGIKDVGILRWQPDVITLFEPSGEPQACTRPWNHAAIHPNGDVMPCMSWTRAPYGNLCERDFDEIFDGQELAQIRTEFDREKPGVDCEHCVVKKAKRTPDDDDFFYLMLRKSPAPAAPVVRQAPPAEPPAPAAPPAEGLWGRLTRALSR